MTVLHHLDMPLTRQNSFNLSPGTENQIAVTPSIITTEQNAISRLSPAERDCYTENEISLKENIYVFQYQHHYLPFWIILFFNLIRAISFFAVLLLYSGCEIIFSISKSWWPELHWCLFIEEQSLPVLLIVYSPTRIFDLKCSELFFD